MKVIIVLLLLVLMVLFIAGYYFFRFACINDRSKKNDFNETDRSPWSKYKEEHDSDMEYIHHLNVEDDWIESFDHLKLHASYFPTNHPKRMILMAHGYKGTGIGDFAKAIVELHDEANILLIDERACGQSEGKIITFGAHEKKDVIDWTLWLNQNKNPDHLPIYLFGVSLGSSTVCQTSNYDFPKEVKGIIADCGYSSFKDIATELSEVLFHIPAWPILPFVEFYCRIIGHFKMDDANTKEALSKTKLPILFIHGKDDTFVLPMNTKRNYEACASEKEVVYIDNAKHANSMYADTTTYFNKVNEFLKKHDV